MSGYPSEGTTIDLVAQQQTAVVLLNADLNIQYLNEAAQSLFQISLSRCEGSEIEAIVALADDIDLTTALTSGQPFTQRAGAVEVPGVGDLELDYSVTPVVEPGPPHLVLEFQPPERHQNINRESQRASNQETARLLTRGLAHEVKNPLGGIRGAAQLLEAELDDPKLWEYTQVIIQEADRLRDLVDRLLGPASRPQHAPVNIHRVLERVLRVIKAESQTGPELLREYDPSIPELEADEAQLIQATMNIVSNAHQALESTPNPQIKLRTQCLRRFTIGTECHRLVAGIDIEDNGPGIHEDIADRLFFPMISGRPNGSGLGLSITQTIIAQHRGLVSVASEPGCTRFSIYLPIT